MIKRIFLKSLILLILVSLSKVHSTNAYFTDTALSTENTFTAGDWTPPESEVNPLATYQGSSSFSLIYTASDNSSGVQQVQLYYSYNYGNWQLFGTDTDIDGEFQFTSPQGDGFYEFKTVAFDNAGNEEDEFLFTDASTTIDTAPSVTMLSLDSYLAVTNELLYNGGFENGNLDGWTIDSSGSDHQVTTEDKKTGAYSALLGFKTASPSVEPAYDSIKQNISLPNWINPTLSFWYRLVTNSNFSGGFFDATIKHGADEIKVAHDGWDDPEVLNTDLGWKNVTYQLNGLEGKNIDIQFKVTQPYEDYLTWSYLDDVKLTAATNSATTTTLINFLTHDGAGSNNSTIIYILDSNPPATYSGTPVTFDISGEHTLKYFSTDEAGNIEPEKKIAINATASAQVDFGVVLNEFLPNPSGDDYAVAPNGEWVKLYNNSTTDVNVAGWKLENASGGSLIINTSNSDNNNNTSDGGETIVPAGGILTVYRNGSSDFAINDDIETVKLYNGSVLIDFYSYNFTVGLSEGKSLKREPDGTGGWKDPEVEIPKVLEEPAQENVEITPKDEVMIEVADEAGGGETKEEVVDDSVKEEIIPKEEQEEESQPEEPTQEEIPAELANETDE